MKKYIDDLQVLMQLGSGIYYNVLLDLLKKTKAYDGYNFSEDSTYLSESLLLNVTNSEGEKIKIHQLVYGKDSVFEDLGLNDSNFFILSPFTTTMSESNTNERESQVMVMIDTKNNRVVSVTMTEDQNGEHYADITADVECVVRKQRKNRYQEKEDLLKYASGYGHAFSDNMLDNIMSDLIGANIAADWCRVSEEVDTTGYDQEYSEQRYLAMLKDGKEIPFYDFEEGKLYKMSFDDLLRGAAQAINHGYVLPDFSDADGVTASAILQFAIFGEVVYG